MDKIIHHCVQLRCAPHRAFEMFTVNPLLELWQVAIAFAKGDAKFILGSVTDDVRWHVAGQNPIQGKDSFAQALEQMKNDRAAELTVSHVISHGKAGAVSGILMLKSGKTRDFDVYEFSSAKGTSVREITSYLIER